MVAAERRDIGHGYGARGIHTTRKQCIRAWAPGGECRARSADAPKCYRHHLDNHDELWVRLTPAWRRLWELYDSLAHDVLHLAGRAVGVHRDDHAECGSRIGLATEAGIVGSDSHAERRGGILPPAVHGVACSFAALEGHARVDRGGSGSVGDGGRLQLGCAEHGDPLSQLKQPRQKPCAQRE
eukprot:scaffold46940_cov32-Tisochrysis_lutea.AAC.7